MDTEKNFYEIWFADGSERTLFKPSEIAAYAERYDFDAKQLLEHGEIDFVDEGQIIGGVQTITFEKEG